MKICSKSLVIRMAAIKNKSKGNKRQKITGTGEGVEKLGSLYTVGGNVKQYSHYRKQ